MKIKIILILFIFAITNINCSKNKTSFITLVFYRDDVIDPDIIQDIGDYFSEMYYCNSTHYEGIPDEKRLIVNLSQSKLLKYNLKYEDVQKVFESEFNKPYPFYYTQEKSIIMFNFNQFIKYKNAKDLGEIIIKKEDNHFIKLRDIASFKFTLISNDIKYNGKLVYKIILEYERKHKKKILNAVNDLKKRSPVKFIIY